MVQQKAQIDTPDSSNTEDVKTIKVHLGIFFDGTNNNKFNIAEYSQRDRRWYKQPISKLKWKLNDSYKRGYTNVAKLFEAYDDTKVDKNEFFKKIYVEGIATAPRRKENDSGGADSIGAGITGWGPYGINGKVERACQLIIKKIKAIVKKVEGENSEAKIQIELDINAFGFSRGAAAARRFLSCVEKASGDVVKRVGDIKTIYKVSLREQIKDAKLNVGNINLCFLGLFDTVSSYGINFTDDVKELSLKVGKVQKVVQLAAADEYRCNFSLTRIKSANSNGMELIIPGDHSDVGGGYLDKEVEKTLIASARRFYDDRRHYLTTLPATYNGCKALDELLEEGWLQNVDEKERTVNNDYSNVALLLMHSYAEELFLSNKIKIHKIPDQLAKISKRIMEIKNNPLYRFTNTAPEKIEPVFNKGDTDFNLLKEIRHDYLHLSAKGGLVNNPAPNNIRLIIDDTKEK